MSKLRASYLRPRLLALLLSAAGTGVFAPGAAGEPPAPRLLEVPCWFEVPSGREARCARMQVPENRAADETRLIDFPVVVFRSGAEQRHPDPVVILGGGGPGYGVGLEAAAAGDWWEWYGPPVLDQGRDLVVMDQRGAGLSRPSLACPELMAVGPRLLAPGVDRAARTALVTTAAARCRTRLSDAGVDLTAYDATAAASDVEDLRRALGAPRWNLIGTSYAARIALTVMRDHPGGVRAVVIDSPVTPEADFYGEGAYSVQRAFGTLAAACESDTACARAYPDVVGTLGEAVRQLNRAPARIQVAYPHSLEPFDMELTGDRLVEVLFGGLYDVEWLPYMPMLIHATRRGSYDLLLPLARSLLKAALDPGYSDGLYYSTQCREELPFNDIELALAAGRGHPLLEGFHSEWVTQEAAVCAVWQSGTANARETMAVRSDIPTLVLSGRFDPVTPPEWALRAVENLPNGYLAEFPAASHDVLSTERCAERLVTDFLQDPRANPLRQDCLREGSALEFVVD